MFGATLSTTKVCEAGVGSGAPDALCARTWNVCVPCDRSNAGANGLVQGANAAVSNRHWKLAAPLTPVNENDGLRLLVGFGGPAVIIVSSAATVNARVVTGGLVNTPSIARTENV